MKLHGKQIHSTDPVSGVTTPSRFHLLESELKFPGHVISIDGVQLHDFDYVDVGAMITPPGVVPMVIKSLLFS